MSKEIYKSRVPVRKRHPVRGKIFVHVIEKKNPLLYKATFSVSLLLECLSIINKALRPMLSVHSSNKIKIITLQSTKLFS